jgi:hypothetical protein
MPSAHITSFLKLIDTQLEETSLITSTMCNVQLKTFCLSSNIAMTLLIEQINSHAERPTTSHATI